VMVHMAGLRNGQWGRRGVMRALGVWHEESDTVAPGEWVSSRTSRLLLTEGVPQKFNSMAEFDRFAARLLLLGLLLGRRVIMPPMPCTASWAQASMEPRHLRGLEVGCSVHKQCVWIPFPHYKEAWCSGFDFLYDIDYREMAQKGKVDPVGEVATVTTGELSFAADADGRAEIKMSGGSAPPSTRVLRLAVGDTLDWLSLDGFENKAKWGRPYQRQIETFLKSGNDGNPSGGPGLTEKQMVIVRDCMHSLATSRD